MCLILSTYLPNDNFYMYLHLLKTDILDVVIASHKISKSIRSYATQYYDRNCTIEMKQRYFLNFFAIVRI